MKTNKLDCVMAGLDTLWWGVSIGGRHYTGKIKYRNNGEYKFVEVDRELSRKEAKQYAQEQDILWARICLQTNKFETLENLERRAAQWCEENFGDNWLLMDNDWYNPNKVIAAKGKYLKIVPALKELYEYYKKLTDIEIEDNWDKIYGKFNKIMGKVKKGMEN